MSASSAKSDWNAHAPVSVVPNGALQHIEKHGSLVRDFPDRAERLRLMKALIEQGFVEWNKSVGKYDLTALGREQHDEDLKIVATKC